jgi:hypothetical protein
MPSEPGAARYRVCRTFALAACWLCVLSTVFGLVGAARAEAPPEAAMLLERLCADTLRANEEDRLYGLISITVRATIKYRGGVFSPDLVDDSVQDGLGALLDACPKIAAADATQRLGIAVGLISAATAQRMQDPKSARGDRQTERATAADLSQELSSQEIDAWLEALPTRQRALALFLYASNVTHQQMADAVGLSLAALTTEFRNAKNGLLKFYREDWDVVPPPIPPAPGMEYRVAGTALSDLLKPDPAAAPRVRITGISSDIFAGWSLLATVIGLPPESGLDLGGPILVEPEKPVRKRMIVVAAEEIGDPHDAQRRFLLKAFAIDGDREGAGLHDTYRIAAAGVDNPQAQQTLASRGLSSIEIARCLSFDYRTGVDPGMCR